MKKGEKIKVRITPEYLNFSVPNELMIIAECDMIVGSDIFADREPAFDIIIDWFDKIRKYTGISWVRDYPSLVNNTVYDFENNQACIMFDHQMINGHSEMWFKLSIVN